MTSHSCVLSILSDIISVGWCFDSDSRCVCSEGHCRNGGKVTKRAFYRFRLLKGCIVLYITYTLYKRKEAQIRHKNTFVLFSCLHYPNKTMMDIWVMVKFTRQGRTHYWRHLICHAMC